jgi:hypothetical protein
MATAKPKACKGCGSTTRKLPYPGPRCTTCHRAHTKAAKTAARGRRLERVYGITGEEADAILEAQGGACAICRRATGKSKALAVDHDHELEKLVGSRLSVRGRLCGPCNDMLGHARDEVEFFERAIEYLKNPPARQVIGEG